MRVFIFILLTLCLAACSHKPSPVVWVSESFSIKDYTSFDIKPAHDATDDSLDQTILIILTVALKNTIEQYNFKLFNSQQEEITALTVESEILSYKIRPVPGSTSYEKNVYASCVLRTRFFDKTSNNFLVEIITIDYLYYDHRGLLEPKIPEKILEESAATVAKELAKIFPSMKKTN